jgi:hypothetical protein
MSGLRPDKVRIARPGWLASFFVQLGQMASFGDLPVCPFLVAGVSGVCNQQASCFAHGKLLSTSKIIVNEIHTYEMTGSNIPLHSS